MYLPPFEREKVPETFAEMLARLRERARLAKADVARAIGLTLSSVYNWEKGYGSAPGLNRVRELASVVKATPEETETLLRLAALERAPEEAGYIQTLSSISLVGPDAPHEERRTPLPLYSQIPAGSPDEVESSGEVYHVLLHQAKKGRYVLKVDGDLMAPTIQDQDLILMEYCEPRPVEEFDGRICAVRCAGEPALRRVQVQGSGDRQIVTLTGDGADSPMDTFLLGDRDFEIVGVALEIVRRRLR